jgi:hypothetical protein
MSNYTFGEKTIEKVKNEDKKWAELEVKKTPKYNQSKTKAIQMIESKDYDLTEGDFWILMNKGGDKMYYTGLIISHNGCLKINDKLPEKDKFKPSAVSWVENLGNKKAMAYINEYQGIYEFGEISEANCKNGYPYAMVLKRLFDRVVLKTSKICFYGIYSDSESEDFKESIERQSSENKTESPHKRLDGIADDEQMETLRRQRKMDDLAAKGEKAKEFIANLKEKIADCKTTTEIESIEKENAAAIKKLETYFDLSVELKEFLIQAKNKASYAN